MSNQAQLIRQKIINENVRHRHAIYMMESLMHKLNYDYADIANKLGIDPFRLANLGLGDAEFTEQEFDAIDANSILYDVVNKKGIGFIGAHRVGKTTTAKALAESTGILYVPINTSQIFRENGLDPSQPLHISTRFDIQKKILVYACDIWIRIKEPFICDRTAIDMLAYMLADIQANSIDGISEQEIAIYEDLCFWATRQYFEDLIIIPPAIPIKSEEGKAPLHMGYIKHVHYLIQGLAFKALNKKHCFPDRCTDFSDRVSTVELFLGL